MAFSLNGNSRTCVLIKDHVIRIVEAKKPDTNSISKIGERYLPPGIIRDGKIIDKDTLIMIIEECLAEWKFKQKKVYYTVPDHSVVIRSVEVPAQIPDKEIRSYLDLVIGEDIHLPFEEPAMDYSVREVEGEKKKIVLVATPKNAVYDYEEIFEELKLKPEVADLSALSVYRLFHKFNFVEENEHIMSLQLNLLSLNISVFHKHEPVFTRLITTNLDHELWEIQKDQEGKETLSFRGEPSDLTNEIQDILTEIERIMNFYRFSVNKGKEGVTKIILTGDHPRLIDFYEKIHEQTGVPVEMIEESSISLRSGEVVPVRYHEAVGLSIKKEV